MDSWSERRSSWRRSRTGPEVGDLKELVRIRKRSRIKSVVLDSVKDDALLVRGRQELIHGIGAIDRQMDWLRNNKRAKSEARKIYRLRTFCMHMDAAESFCLRSTALLVVLFVMLYLIRGMAIFTIPELFLECSAAHSQMHGWNYTSAHSTLTEDIDTSSTSALPLSGLRLRWILFRGHHPCVPIYMECFALPETVAVVAHPHQGQY